MIYFFTGLLCLVIFGGVWLVIFGIFGGNFVQMNIRDIVLIRNLQLKVSRSNKSIKLSKSVFSGSFRTRIAFMFSPNQIQITDH